jgi:ABC-type nitrate/sulfonate/bicarbonate transport system substrate-binding protein
LAAVTTAGVLAVGGCGGDDGNGSAAGGSKEPANATQDIKLLYTNAFTGHLPVLIANDAGIFKRNHLNAKLIASDQPLQPLLSGDVDMAFPSPAVAAIAAAQGQEVKVVAGIQGKITQALLLRADVAKELSATGYPQALTQLKGKTLAVTTRGGAVDLDLRYMLKNAGLTPDKDVKIVAAGGGAQMLAALKGKQVDGILGFPPLSYQVLNDGVAVKVLDLAEGEGPAELSQPLVVATTTQEFLDGHKEAVKDFVAAMQETMDYVKDPANEAAVEKIIRTRFQGVNEAVIPAIMNELRTTLSASFTPQDLENVIAVQNEVGKLPGSVTPDQLIATDVVPQPR